MNIFIRLRAGGRNFRASPTFDPRAWREGRGMVNEMFGPRAAANIRTICETDDTFSRYEGRILQVIANRGKSAKTHERGREEKGNCFVVSPP